MIGNAQGSFESIRELAGAAEAKEAHTARESFFKGSAGEGAAAKDEYQPRRVRYSQRSLAHESLGSAEEQPPLAGTGALPEKTVVVSSQ